MPLVLRRLILESTATDALRRAAFTRRPPACPESCERGGEPPSPGCRVLLLGLLGHRCGAGRRRGGRGRLGGLLGRTGSLLGARLLGLGALRLRAWLRGEDALARHLDDDGRLAGPLPVLVLQRVEELDD